MLGLHFVRSRTRPAAPVALGAALATVLLVSGCTQMPSVAPPSASSSARATSSGASSPVVTLPATTAAAQVPVASSSRAARARVVRPTGGAVLEQVRIPSSDGFAARPAYLYLPPEAVKHPDRRLPVLELLHGTPGQPVDWINGGLLVPTINAFVAAHHGQAPIIVMPDLNGAHRADSQCIRTADGKNTESYLTSDVVTWVRHRFARTVGREKWWVAGLSEGGVCSLMLALRHPHLYSALGDFSGLAAPIVDHLTQAQSDRQLYGGSVRDKQEHEPLWLLARHRYVGLPAWFECGSSDRHVLPQQAEVVAAARSAHLDVHVAFVPGKHAWTVWSAAFRSLLPWLWARR